MLRYILQCTSPKLFLCQSYATYQGANVPLAAQALVRHLVGEEISLPVFFSLFNVNILDLEDNVDGLSDGLALLQSPATQQIVLPMLVYNYTTLLECQY